MLKKPKKHTKKSKIVVRRSWGDLNPATRVHETAANRYDRKRVKRVVKKEIEAYDWNEDGDQE